MAESHVWQVTDNSDVITATKYWFLLACKGERFVLARITTINLNEFAEGEDLQGYH